MEIDPELNDRQPERRQHRRVHVYIVTRFYKSCSKDCSATQTRIADLSEGGARLMTFDEGLPVGSDIVIDFDLPDASSQDSISVLACVRHSAHHEKDLFRSGVEFLDLKPFDRERLRGFIAEEIGYSS